MFQLYSDEGSRMRTRFNPANLVYYLINPYLKLTPGENEVDIK